MDWMDELRAYLAHLEHKNFAVSTRRSTQKTLAQFFLFAWREGRGELRSSADVGKGTIEAWAKHLALEPSPITGKPYAISTQRVYLWTVKIFYEWLEKEGRVLVSPAAEIELPRQGGHRIGNILSEEAAKRLVEAPNVSVPMGVRDRAILEIFYGTGLRLAEVLALSIYDVDVDLDAGTLRVQQGKGKKDRLVPLGKTAAHYVAEYLKNVRTRYAKKRRLASSTLFLDRQGDPVSEKAIRHMVYKYAAKVGVRASPHAIRRSTATHLLASGASPEIVAELLGHSSMASLGFYSKLFGRELKKEHERTHPRERDGRS